MGRDAEDRENRRRGAGVPRRAVSPGSGPRHRRPRRDQHLRPARPRDVLLAWENRRFSPWRRLGGSPSRSSFRRGASWPSRPSPSWTRSSTPRGRGAAAEAYLATSSRRRGRSWRRNTTSGPASGRREGVVLEVSRRGALHHRRALRRMGGRAPRSLRRRRRLRPDHGARAMSGGGAAARLPGFPLALGVALSGLSLVVLLPILALALRRSSSTARRCGARRADPAVLAAVRLSLGTALGAGGASRRAFSSRGCWSIPVSTPAPRRRRGRLPFALPTAIAGIALTTLWAPTGWLGGPLAALGVKVAFTERHRPRPRLPRPSVFGPDAPAGPRGARSGGGGGGREPRRDAPRRRRAHLLPELLPAC